MSQELKNINDILYGYKYYQNIVVDDDVMDMVNNLLALPCENCIKYHNKLRTHTGSKKINIFLFKYDIKGLILIYIGTFKVTHAMSELDSMMHIIIVPGY